MSTATAPTPTPTPAAPQPIIPGLPDDISTNIIARIPISEHPTLSLVSKPIKSLLSSSLLFSTRLSLNATQHLLFLSLRSPNNTSSLLYLLSLRNPHNTLCPVPSPPPPFPTTGAAFVSLAHNVYVIGGSINDVASSHVWVFDSRFRTWELGPKMRVAREFAAAGVVDGKIYVMGGCNVDTYSRAANWAEVLDLGAGKWESVSSPVEVREKWMHANAVVGGRIYAMADRGGVCFDPESGNWEGVEGELDLGWRGRACVIGEVLYCYDFLGNIRGFDFKEGAWKELRGVDKGLPRFLCGATMANVGGKLVVVWEGKESGREMGIWCAGIDIEKAKDGELRGQVEWCNKVLSVPSRSSIVHCLAVTL